MIDRRLILEKQPVGKVSEFFSYEEFTQSNYGKPVFTKINKYLLECLCRNILDPVREEFGHPILVSSGIRDINVMNGLRSAGYHPSPSTDHSFGDPEVNPFGVGAADIRPYGQSKCEDIFNITIHLIKTSSNFNVGQVLWEQQGSRDWVHISNPKTALFQQEVARMIASGLVIGYGLEGKYFSEIPWN
jgi:hypothetical protein